MDPRPPAFIHTARTDPYPCPICRRELDAATGISSDPAAPRPELAVGDVTCCAYCGSVLTLTTIGFRLATDPEIANLDPPLRALLFQFAASRGRGRPT